MKSQHGKIKSAEIGERIIEATEKLHALDNSLRVAESNFEHSAEMIKDALARISEIEKSKAAIKISKDEKLASLDKVNDTLNEKMDERMTYLQKQQELTERIDKLQAEIDHAYEDLIVEENTATDLKVRIDVLRNAIINDGFKSKQIEEEISSYEEEGVKLKEEADRCEKNASGFKAKINEKDSSIAELSSKIEELSSKRDSLNEKYNSSKVDYDSLMQRADTLERMNEHFDGYIESVRFVMREYNAGNIRGAGRIYGPLSSLIAVDKEYITAIETALGASLQNIVVEDENTAKAAIYALKRASAGRATFYPINAIKPSREIDEASVAKTMPGFVGRADTLVRSDSKYRSVIEYLLLRTLVFDNIDNASVAAKRIGYKIKIVTLDGQIINSGGSFTGGSAKRDSGILSRSSDIASMREKCKELYKVIEELKAEISNINNELSVSSKSLHDIEGERELLIALSRTHLSASDHATASFEANRSIVAKLRQDFENIVNNNGKADEEISSLTADLSASKERAAALAEFRSAKAADKGVLDDNRDEIITKVNDVNVSIAETRKEIEAIQLLIDSIDARISELDDEISLQNERDLE